MIWGPVIITRWATFPRRNGRSYVVRVNDLDIYVSPKGKRTRVFRAGRELK